MPSLRALCHPLAGRAAIFHSGIDAVSDHRPAGADAATSPPT
ncbi:MAG TPA: hypothetical protein VG165_12990 [Solirubrobacteraceae bacterium]|nr:hypothetical protein [Solirubrobacteraceae bacterium]